MSGLDSKSLCLICQSGPGLKKNKNKKKKEKERKKERERLVDCFKLSILMRVGGGGGEDGVGMLGHTK